ncbi:MAG TPA: hypothetical protein DDY77_04695 [Clostridiales bacterium]|nr:hypothetical protein [Clostridiales bacterium]
MAKGKTKKKKKLSFWQVVLVVIIALLIIAAYYYYHHYIMPPDTSGNSSSVNTIEGKLESDLRIHYVDVNQGDAIIIQFPNNKNMIIDSGDKKSDSKAKLKNYIDKLEITKFDYLIATHQDTDHIGGMDVIFKNYEVDYVFRPYVLSTNSNASTLPDGFNQGLTKEAGGTPSNTATYYNFLNYIVEEKCGYEFFNKDSDFAFDIKDGENSYKCVFDFLTPTANKNEIGYKNNNNNYSPIIMLTYADNKFVFVGDAEKETEKELLDYYKNDNLTVDVLKVGHHGSETSSSKDFLAKIQPKYAVISCGKGNKFYHPRQLTLDNLTDPTLSYDPATIYRTDLQGNIVITVSKPEEVGGKGQMTIKVDNENVPYADLLVGADTIKNSSSSSASSSAA